MTQFGFTPSSSSPAARRIYEAGNNFRSAKAMADPIREELAAIRDELAAEKLALSETKRLRDKLAKESKRLLHANSQACKSLERSKEEIVRLGIEGARIAASAEFSSGIKKIIDDGCELFGISMPMVVGEGRDALTVNCRRYIVERIREEIGLSHVKIGRVLGNRDHTTILNLYKTRTHWRRFLEQEKANVICQLPSEKCTGFGDNRKKS